MTRYCRCAGPTACREAVSDTGHSSNFFALGAAMTSGRTLHTITILRAGLPRASPIDFQVWTNFDADAQLHHEWMESDRI